MKAHDLSIFCAPGGGPSLSFAGDRVADELLNGTLTVGDEQIGRVVDGIISFVSEPVNWPAADIAQLRAKRQIEHSWENEIYHAAEVPTRLAFCEELAATDGLILEVAAGPGGGNVAPVLSRNPSARIIVNDVSLAVLQLWQEFLRARCLGSELCLAAFDARRMPITSESVAGVSGALGFSSVSGLDVFRETYRILQPDGVVFSDEMVVEPDDWARMPSDRRTEWEASMPSLTLGAGPLLAQHGFEVVSREFVPGRELVPDEGGLPRDAADHGVTLHIVWEYVRARKR